MAMTNPGPNLFIFKFLQVIAWVIFVGLCIEAGGLLVNFFFSLYRPELLPNLYQKLDLTEMYESSSTAFFSMYGFALVIAILKTVMFYIIVRLMHKLDLSRPFSPYVAKQISRVGTYTFSIGLLSYIARQTANNLQHRNIATGSLAQFWEDSEAYFLMAAVIYIIAIIFKTGVDIQNENDLTV